MEIKQDYNLSKLNTFGVDVSAKFFAALEKEKDIAELFQLPEFRENKKIFLGGGSNVLFTKDFEGIVVLNKLKGMEIVEEDQETATVRSMGGEIWHNMVIFAVSRGLWGIENLSLIPGTAGAAPMQNIGAYGAELKNTLLNVEAYEIETGEKKIFQKEECELGYRDSIFKNKVKGKYFISAVTLRLSKRENKNLSYRILTDYLEQNKIKVNGPKDISDAVAAIRMSKLPDPKVIGNAGSFFKNVFVPEAQFKKLLEAYPDMPHFEEDGIIKIPSGWLIEKCGWKGFREGEVGVHSRQALVLVNHGKATGADLIDLAHKIIASVKEKFGLELSPEVNIV
ncbi:MAG TPA: UDP-N-acetylmuramate dehydrogenase [Candidatus Paceibacterota bacterium]